VEGADHGMTGPILDVRDVRLSRGSREVLQGVSLRVSRGELVALMSLSGGGKTTVLRTVAALEPFDAGEIHVDGVALRPGRLPREGRLRDLRRRVGMVFQLHHLFEHLTALDNVTLAPVHALKVTRATAAARARELLDELGVSARANALPRELSGGEAQRVAIARALATDPPLLLLDEPTASLDPARRGELGETLRSLAASGRHTMNRALGGGSAVAEPSWPGAGSTDSAPSHVPGPRWKRLPGEALLPAKRAS
jgi:ABC-type polar amino acid transport system ATPase subunit